MTFQKIAEAAEALRDAAYEVAGARKREVSARALLESARAGLALAEERYSAAKAAVLNAVGQEVHRD